MSISNSFTFCYVNNSINIIVFNKEGFGRSPSGSENPFTESDYESDTEDDITVRSVIEVARPARSTLRQTNSVDASPVKRIKVDQLKPDKSTLSLPLRRPTGGCGTLSRPPSSPSTAPSTPGGTMSPPAAPVPGRLCVPSSSPGIRLDVRSSPLGMVNNNNKIIKNRQNNLKYIYFLTLFEAQF